MKNYKQQIKEYKEEIEEKYVRAEAENKIVKACQNILSESVLSKQSHRTSYFEFLYEQTKFIKKRWWILQGCVLMCLWIWLSNYTSDIKRYDEDYGNICHNICGSDYPGNLEKQKKWCD